LIMGEDLEAEPLVDGASSLDHRWVATRVGCRAIRSW
jgi:hypothetical protein